MFCVYWHVTDISKYLQLCRYPWIELAAAYLCTSDILLYLLWSAKGWLRAGGGSIQLIMARVEKLLSGQLSVITLSTGNIHHPGHGTLPCFKSLADYIEKFLPGAEQISELSVLWRKFWAGCQCSPDSNLLLPRTRWPSCWRTGPTRSWSSRRWRRTSEVNIPILGTFVTPDRVHCRRGPLVPAPGCAQTHEVRNYAEQRVIQRLSIVA